MPYDIRIIKGSSSGEVTEATTRLPDLTREQVFIKVTHSGVCGTDEHVKHSDVPLGHEGVGVVQAIGPDVKALKIGDRVGWGYFIQTCGHCDACTEGDFWYCKDSKDKINYGMPDTYQGSFSSAAIINEPFLFRLPDRLASDLAAPLMCGGITVWQALHDAAVKPSDCVGIVGIGGLGHLAIQFAAHFGCDVVAISGTESKREEALALGARAFLSTSTAGELTLDRPINHLLVTTAKMPDWTRLSPLLAPKASIYPLTITDPHAKLEIPFLMFVVKGWRFVGSTAARKIEYRRMLEFAARKGVKPVVQAFPLTPAGVGDVLEKLDRGEVRYRGVLYADRA